MMQKLAVYQSLWGMQLCNPDEQSRPHEEVFQQAADANFSGMCLDPGVSQIEEYLGLKPLYEQHQMECLVNVFPNTVAEMKPLLEFCKEMGAPFANVIAPVFPLTVEGAVPIIRTWLDMADDIGVPIKFETHRDCITNERITRPGFNESSSAPTVSRAAFPAMSRYRYQFTSRRTRNGWQSTRIGGSVASAPGGPGLPMATRLYSCASWALQNTR
jgi:hypothetical protein